MEAALAGLPDANGPSFKLDDGFSTSNNRPSIEKSRKSDPPALLNVGLAGYRPWQRRDGGAGDVKDWELRAAMLKAAATGIRTRREQMLAEKPMPRKRDSSSEQNLGQTPGQRK